MSIYFIEAPTGRFELTSTTSISKTLTGKITDNPVESGLSLSDNYVQMPDTFNLEGIITDIGSSLRGLRSESRTSSIIKTLSDLKINSQTFTFHFGDVIAESLNCMFESLSFSQDRKNGSTRGINSFKVKARFRQVNFVEKVLITNKREELVKDKYQKTEDSSQTTESASDRFDDLEKKALANISGEINNTNLFPDG